MFMGNVDINKALDSTTSSGQALIPQIVNEYMLELALKVAPLRTLIPRTPWKSGTYDRNKRTAYGQGRFVGDAVSMSETNSTIVRFQEPLKVLMAKGGVTGFQQEASQELIDALQMEVKGHTTALCYEEEFALLYANRLADSKYFNGIDSWIQTNVTDAADDSISFDLIDTAIDNILKVGGKPGFITMSFAMQSRLSKLLVNQQRFLDKVEIAGGARLITYRDIPVYPTSFMSANQAWTGSTVTAAPAAGGALADGVYRYQLSAVLQSGETLPSVECNATTATTNNSVLLTWTGSANVRFYKVFRSAKNGATGSCVLYTVIPGVAYTTASDLVGTLSTSGVYKYTDDGQRVTQTVAYVASDLSTVVGAAYTPTKTEYPLAADQEDIFVVSTDVPNVEGYACEVPVLSEMGYMPLAKIADKDWFLIKAYETLVMAEQFSAKIHRVNRAVKP